MGDGKWKAWWIQKKEHEVEADKKENKKVGSKKDQQNLGQVKGRGKTGPGLGAQNQTGRIS